MLWAAASIHQKAPSCQIPIKPQTTPIWGCLTLRASHLAGAALAQLRIRQSPAQLWVRPGRTAELNCSTDSGWNASRHRAVNWYREQPGSRLQFIYQSSNSPRSDGKYSGMRRAEGLFSLHISSAQKEDSGFYYCASTTHPSEFGDGTRLVVTGEHRDITGTKQARDEGAALCCRALALPPPRYLCPRCLQMPRNPLSPSCCPWMRICVSHPWLPSRCSATSTMSPRVGTRLAGSTATAAW